MSRGPGRIQQSILALVESNEDGAWTTSEICIHVYRGANRAEKKHRVAVSRALRRMTLPESWTVVMLERSGGEYILFNRVSVESTTKKRWQSSFSFCCDYEKFKSSYGHIIAKARDEVAKHRRYFEADELGRVTIRIAECRNLAALGFATELKALIERKAELEATPLSVSAASRYSTGNTYQERAL